MTTINPIFAPVIALAGWSMLMMVWMLVVRIGAVQKLTTPLAPKPGMRGSDLEGVIPDKATWPAHNYNHLMEQPTVFYAVALVLAIAGGSGLDAQLAWGYAGLRIVHSLVQATFNNVNVRFLVWGLASIVLIVMIVRAAMLVF